MLVPPRHQQPQLSSDRGEKKKKKNSSSLSSFCGSHGSLEPKLSTGDSSGPVRPQSYLSHLGSTEPLFPVHIRCQYYLHFFLEIMERQTITFCVLPLTSSRRVWRRSWCVYAMMRLCIHMQVSMFPCPPTKATPLNSLCLLNVCFSQYAKQENSFLFTMDLRNASSSSSILSSSFSSSSPPPPLLLLLGSLSKNSAGYGGTCS